eukprot:gene15602-biopygen1584
MPSARRRSPAPGIRRRRLLPRPLRLSLGPCLHRSPTTPPQQYSIGLAGPGWDGDGGDPRRFRSQSIAAEGKHYRSEAESLPVWQQSKVCSVCMTSRYDSDDLRVPERVRREPLPQGCGGGWGKVAKSSRAAGGLLADLADCQPAWRTWRTAAGGLGGLGGLGLADLADSASESGGLGGLDLWAWRTRRTAMAGPGGLGGLGPALADSGRLTAGLAGFSRLVLI